MWILIPDRHPLIRGFAMTMMLLLTALTVTCVLAVEEDMLGVLWTEEHRPHPVPWPTATDPSFVVFSHNTSTTATPQYLFGADQQPVSPSYALPSPSPVTPLDDVSPFRNNEPIFQNLTINDNRPTAMFMHDLMEPHSINSYDYRWAFVNFRDSSAYGGSLRIDRKTGQVLYCLKPYNEWGVGADPRQWCRDRDSEGEGRLPFVVMRGAPEETGETR